MIGFATAGAEAPVVKERCALRRNSSEPTDEPTLPDPDYEPPRASVVGTVRELTQASGAGIDDAAVFSAGAVSDRRLKEHVRPVDARALLTTLADL
jgi:hypothetical protein